MSDKQVIFIIRSDNGSEFKNYIMSKFLSDEGIKHQYAVAYCEQNFSRSPMSASENEAVSGHPFKCMGIEYVGYRDSMQNLSAESRKPNVMMKFISSLQTLTPRNFRSHSSHVTTFFEDVMEAGGGFDSTVMRENGCIIEN